jgi:hypothetical protein
MPVSDKQAATLRAQLAGDLERHKRLLDELDNHADGRAYVTLTNAAFFEAVRRRFGVGGTPDDVIAFVAEVRTRSERVGDALDPHISERVLLAAIDGADTAGLDPREARSSQRFLLAAMVADEQFDDADLDKFIARARAMADELLLARADSGAAPVKNGGEEEHLTFRHENALAEAGTALVPADLVSWPTRAGVSLSTVGSLERRQGGRCRNWTAALEAELASLLGDHAATPAPAAQDTPRSLQDRHGRG